MRVPDKVCIPIDESDKGLVGLVISVRVNIFSIIESPGIKKGLFYLFYSGLFSIRYLKKLILSVYCVTVNGFRLYSNTGSKDENQTRKFSFVTSWVGI